MGIGSHTSDQIYSNFVDPNIICIHYYVYMLYITRSACQDLFWYFFSISDFRRMTDFRSKGIADPVEGIRV